MRYSTGSRLAFLAALVLALTVFPSPVIIGGARAANVTAVATPCGQHGAWRSAMDAANIYWTDFDGGTVVQAPLRGGTPTVLASGQPGPCGIAVDRKWVYWSNNRGGS